MSSPPTLLEVVRGLLERTYRIECGLEDLSPFLIGDAGFRRLYAGKRLHRSAASGEVPGAQLLVREEGAKLRVCVYYPDHLIRTLEEHPPQSGLDGANVDAFSTFVEEIDHLLLLAERTRLRRPLTLFEMELHANVSKYLVLSRFLVGRAERGVSPERRLWLRHELFERPRFREDDQGLFRRYRDALRWSVKYLDSLGRIRARERLASLRRFHDAGAHEKLRLIEAGEAA